MADVKAGRNVAQDIRELVAEILESEPHEIGIEPTSSRIWGWIQ